MAGKTFWQWWNTVPALAIRLVCYAAILLVFLYWPRESPPPTQPADEEPGVPPPAPLEPDEKVSQLYGYAPQAEFLAWSRRDLPDGGQEVQVLVRFLANVRDMDWPEAKLRAPKGQGGEDLAAAEGPPEAPKPELGPARLLFHLPPGKAPFIGGRVFCWNKDLCTLPPEQKVSPEELEARLKQEQSKTPAQPKPEPPAPAPTPEKPASSTPPPPAATEKP
jgi:hypothetical protein